MGRLSTRVLIFFFLAGPNWCWAQALPTQAKQPADLASLVTENYEVERLKANSTEQMSRTVMSLIYQINRRMLVVSRKRNALNNQMLSVEGGVRTLARSASEVEVLLTNQRQQLGRRLRAMYLLGNESVARALFSATTTQDLDQSLKYLQIISKHDFDLIRSYRRNLQELKRRRDHLGREVKNLISIKEKIKRQEEQLEADQSSKAQLLQKLANEKKKALEKMASLKSHAEKQNILDLINLSFFEHKGQMNPPVEGSLVRGFGLSESEEYHYRLAHKGHRYQVLGEKAVRSIFKGNVAYVGSVDGCGQTIIIDHGDHYYTVYSGLKSVSVDIGQKIEREVQIALARGDLYFELRHFSDAIDPAPWMSSAKKL